MMPKDRTLASRCSRPREVEMSHQPAAVSFPLSARGVGNLALEAAKENARTAAQIFPRSCPRDGMPYRGTYIGPQVNVGFNQACGLVVLFHDARAKPSGWNEQGPSSYPKRRPMGCRPTKLRQ